MKRAKIILLIFMALLAAVGLFVTFKPLMERASRQKQVDEANDSFIQQLEQIQSVKDAEPEATPYAQLREQIEQYNTWLYEGKQIALTNAAAYEQPAFILTQYGLQDETFGIDYGNKYCHDSPTLDEEPLHRAILAAINSSVKDKDNIVYNLKAAIEKELAPVAGQQLSLSEIDNQLERLNTEFSKVLAEASESGDQAVYSDKFREIMQKQTALKAQRNEIQRMLAESGKAADHIDQCRQAAEVMPVAITEWDEALIRQVVESVTVETDGGIVVALKSGASIHQELM